MKALLMKDLRTLKEMMLKIGKKEYDEMFKPTSKNIVNYYNYINPVAWSGDKTDGFYKYVKKAIEKSEDNKINLYKIKLGKGSNVIAFSNCIYYDNQNKTLPVGMDNDTRIIAKLSDMNIELDSKKVIKVGKLDDEEMGTKLIVKNINILEYTVKQMEEE